MQIHPVRGAIAALLLLFGGTAYAAPLTADDAVRAALQYDPQHSRAEADLLAARGALRAASGPRYNPRVEGRGAGSYVEIEAVQPLSLTGEGIAAARSARASRDAAELSVARSRLETAARARLAWADAAVATGRARLSGQALDLARRLREATEARVQAGEASSLDLRLARLEEAKAAAAHLQAEADQAQALRVLAALTGLDVDALPADADPLMAAPGDGAPGGGTAGDPGGPPPGGGVAGAEPPPQEKERTDVAAADRRVEAARSAVTRERAAILPAVELGAFVERDGDTTQVGPIVGIEVPLWQQNQGGVAAARADLLAAEREAESLRARAEAESVTSARRMTELSHASAVLGEGLTEEAGAALDSIEAGYRAGELDLLQTVLLRTEVVSGLDAVLGARGDLAAARIDFLLAAESDALIPGGAE